LADRARVADEYIQIPALPFQRDRHLARLLRVRGPRIELDIADRLAVELDERRDRHIVGIGPRSVVLLDALERELLFRAIGVPHGADVGLRPPSKQLPILAVLVAHLPD